ncbi:MAG: hypothetical protein R3F30_09765 [Planctomycetota bacterium]
MPEPRRLLSFRTWLVLVLGLAVGLGLMKLSDLWLDDHGGAVPIQEPPAQGTTGDGSFVPEPLADPRRREELQVPAQDGIPRRLELRFVEQGTGVALAGVRVLDLDVGRGAGPSDERGVLDLGPDLWVGQGAHRMLAFGPDLLCRRFQAYGEDHPDVVELRRDVFTVPLEVVTRFPTGRAPRAGKRFHLQLAHPGGKPIDGASIPTIRYGGDRTIPEELRQAWLEHRLLTTVDSGYLVSDAHPVAQVLQSGGLPLLLPERGGTLRFAEDGAYVLRAWTDDGYVAERQLDVDPGANAPLLVEFRPGAALEVHLCDAGGKPLSQGHVYLLFGEDRSPQHGEVDALGRVHFTSLFVEQGARVRAEAPGFRDQERPLTLSGPPLELRMVPLPKVEVDLVVQERGSGDPVAGAEVRLDSDKGVAAEGRTDARGVIRLPFYDGETQRLSVLHRGFHQWIEVVDRAAGGEVPRRIELLPEDAARLVELGLACRIHGRAPGAKGGAVKLAPQDLGLQGPGPRSARRVVTGERLEDQTSAVVDDEGRFELVTARTGPAVLFLMHDGKQSSQVVELALGATLEPVF